MTMASSPASVSASSSRGSVLAPQALSARAVAARAEVIRRRVGLGFCGSEFISPYRTVVHRTAATDYLLWPRLLPGGQPSVGHRWGWPAIVSAQNQHRRR